MQRAGFRPKSAYPAQDLAYSKCSINRVSLARFSEDFRPPFLFPAHMHVCAHPHCPCTHQHMQTPVCTGRCTPDMDTHSATVGGCSSTVHSLSLELGCLSLQIREESWVALIFSFKQSCFLYVLSCLGDRSIFLLRDSGFHKVSS